LEILDNDTLNRSPGSIPGPVLDFILKAEPESDLTREALFSLACKTDPLELAISIVRHGWTYSTERDMPLGRRISGFLGATLAGRMPLEQLAQQLCPLDFPTLAEGVTDDELRILSSMIEKSVVENRAQTLTVPTCVGASRLVETGAPWIAAHILWLQQAARAMIPGTHPKIDSFAATLISAARDPIPGAADYLMLLLRLTPITRESGSLRILKPTLAAAASEPTRQRELLDGLVLGITEDRVLS